MAIAEVIKFEGPQDALVWKFPIEDFNATSQPIVSLSAPNSLLRYTGNSGVIIMNEKKSRKFATQARV